MYSKDHKTFFFIKIINYFKCFYFIHIKQLLSIFRIFNNLISELEKYIKTYI